MKTCKNANLNIRVVAFIAFCTELSSEIVAFNANLNIRVVAFNANLNIRVKFRNWSVYRKFTRRPTIDITRRPSCMYSKLLHYAMPGVLIHNHPEIPRDLYFMIERIRFGDSSR